MELYELKNQLLNVDNRNRNEILKLLIQAYYYNDELIQDGFYEELYNKLKVDYKPITEDEPVAILNNKMEMNNEVTLDDYSLIVLEKLLVFIKGNVGISDAIVKELFYYHNKVNKEFIRDLYTDNINDTIGKPAVAVGKNNNKRFLESGKLSYNGGYVIDDKKLDGQVYQITSGKKIIYFYDKMKKKKNKKRKKAA